MLIQAEPRFFFDRCGVVFCVVGLSNTSHDFGYLVCVPPLPRWLQLGSPEHPAVHIEGLARCCVFKLRRPARGHGQGCPEGEAHPPSSIPCILGGLEQAVHADEQTRLVMLRSDR